MENTGAATRRSGFWRQQIAKSTTENQDLFDFFFCVIAPMMCVFFDPIVFATNFGPAFLAGWKFLSYLALGVAVMLFLLLKTFRMRSVVLSVALFGAAAFSLVIGICILPLTLLGSAALIGLLGFTPFFTAFAYARTSYRYWPGAQRSHWKVGLGLLLIPVLPILVDAGVKRVAASSVEKIIHGSPADAERASEQLRPVRFAVDCDDLVRAYADENDQIKKDQIARAYKKVTGEEIYPRLAILLD